MLKFVDLRDVYWIGDSEAPVCAFLSTRRDLFIPNLDGTHVFGCLEHITRHPESKWMLAVIPQGYFKGEEHA